MRDPDGFRTPDSEDEGSTDVSNPYRKVRWTEKAPLPTEPEDDPGAKPEEEGPIIAFQNSPSQLHLMMKIHKTIQ